MSRTDNNKLLLEKMENRLQRIANVLLLNASFIDFRDFNPGVTKRLIGLTWYKIDHYERKGQLNSREQGA
jgi:hypothetical protein